MFARCPHHAETSSGALLSRARRWPLRHGGTMDRWVRSGERASTTHRRLDPYRAPPRRRPLEAGPVRPQPARSRPAAPLRRFGGQHHRRRLAPTFRSAVAGLQCAAAILAALRDTDIEVRIGVHTGEVEPMGNNFGGVPVHAAARIMALAGPSESSPPRSPSASPMGAASPSRAAARRSQGTGSDDRGVPARVTPQSVSLRSAPPRRGSAR
jgi:hypothetical protein